MNELRYNSPETSTERKVIWQLLFRFFSKLVWSLLVHKIMVPVYRRHLHVFTLTYPPFSLFFSFLCYSVFFASPFSLFIRFHCFPVFFASQFSLFLRFLSLSLSLSPTSNHKGRKRSVKLYLSSLISIYFLIFFFTSTLEFCIHCYLLLRLTWFAPLPSQCGNISSSLDIHQISNILFVIYVKKIYIYINSRLSSKALALLSKPQPQSRRGNWTKKWGETLI